jgi:hypothetical protein
MTTVGLGGGLTPFPLRKSLNLPNPFLSPAPKTKPPIYRGFFKPLKTQPVRHAWTWSCITVLPFYGFLSLFSPCVFTPYI